MHAQSVCSKLASGLQFTRTRTVTSTTSQRLRIPSRVWMNEFHAISKKVAPRASQMMWSHFTDQQREIAATFSAWFLLPASTLFYWILRALYRSTTSLLFFFWSVLHFFYVWCRRSRVARAEKQSHIPWGTRPHKLSSCPAKLHLNERYPTNESVFSPFPPVAIS